MEVDPMEVDSPASSHSAASGPANQEPASAVDPAPKLAGSSRVTKKTMRRMEQKLNMLRKQHTDKLFQLREGGAEMSEEALKQTRVLMKLIHYGKAVDELKLEMLADAIEDLGCDG